MKEIILDELSVNETIQVVKTFSCKKTGKTISGQIFCDGWSITSPNNRTYELLEGKGLDGNTTSDIVFVFEVNDGGYKCLVQYFFGSDTPQALYTAIDYIKDYEAGKRFDLGNDLD